MINIIPMACLELFLLLPISRHRVSNPNRVNPVNLVDSPRGLHAELLTKIKPPHFSIFG